MKYICFGYYDKSKFDGLTEAERNTMFDTCFEYDDHLRASGHWAGGEALQGPETAPKHARRRRWVSKSSA